MNKTRRIWDRRDWWFFIALISLGQACIWFLSYHYGTNNSALGYVSFAGTLISIILAVLAIGYTYGESHQQKNSSITLANQIESLVEIKNKLEIQADALTDIRTVKNHILDLSEKLESSFKETNSNIAGFKELYIDQNSNDSYGLEDIDREILLKNLIGEKPTKFTELIIVVTILYFEQRKVYKGKGFLALKDFFEEKSINVGGVDMYNRIFGATVQLALILNRCGFLSAQSGSVDRHLLDQFNSIVNNDSGELERVFNLPDSSLLNFAKTSKYYKEF